MTRVLVGKNAGRSTATILTTESLQETVTVLRERGCAIRGIEGLRPVYLGQLGYVGCLVPMREGPEKRRVWIAPDWLAFGYTPRLRAACAEWMTLTLAREPQRVKTLIDLWLGHCRKGAVNFRMFADQLGWRVDIRGASDVELAGILSRTANVFQMVGDPLAEWIELPENHPMRAATSASPADALEARDSGAAEDLGGRTGAEHCEAL